MPLAIGWQNCSFDPAVNSKWELFWVKPIYFSSAGSVLILIISTCNHMNSLAQGGCGARTEKAAQGCGSEEENCYIGQKCWLMRL